LHAAVIFSASALTMGVASPRAWLRYAAAMSAALKLAHRATAAALMAIPEHERFHEIIGGELVRKAMPSPLHGLGQSQVVTQLSGSFNRRPGGRGPGGWWILSEVEIQLEEHEVYRPDVAGWRRERMPELPKEAPVLVRPDWICEVLSPSNAGNDLVKKWRVYHRASVPHYWIVDPERETLSVCRWQADGYLIALSAQSGERVQAEPFAEVELDVGALFGDEQD
jgi:Uma2 family endonuclease